MSEDGIAEETTAVSAEVSVTKRLELEEFEDPVIAFDIESRRDGSAAVTVVDSIPERVSPRDLRFHPEYGSEHWVIDDGELVFEREFDPGEEYVTVYRLCGAKDDVIDAFEDPAVGVEFDVEVTPGAGTARGMVRGAGSTAEATNGNPGGEAGPEADNEIPTLELSDPAVDDGTDEGETAPAEGRPSTVVTDTAGEVGDHGDTDRADSAPEHDVPSEGEADTPTVAEGTHETAHGTDAESGEGSLAAALAAELEAGTVPADDVERLRAALGRHPDEPRGVVTRVEKLQHDVDEVLAYTDALAEFREEIDSFREEMGRLEADLNEAQTAARRAEDRVGDIETAVNDGFEEVKEELRVLRAEVRGVHRAGDGDIDERLSKLEQDVGDLRDWRGRLATVLREPDA